MRHEAVYGELPRLAWQQAAGGPARGAPRGHPDRPRADPHKAGRTPRAGPQRGGLGERRPALQPRAYRDEVEGGRGVRVWRTSWPHNDSRRDGQDTAAWPDCPPAREPPTRI